MEQERIDAFNRVSAALAADFQNSPLPFHNLIEAIGYATIALDRLKIALHEAPTAKSVNDAAVAFALVGVKVAVDIQAAVAANQSHVSESLTNETSADVEIIDPDVE